MTTYVRQGRIATLLIMLFAALALAFSLAFASPAKAGTAETPVEVYGMGLVCSSDDDPYHYLYVVNSGGEVPDGQYHILKSAIAYWSGDQGMIGDQFTQNWIAGDQPATNIAPLAVEPPNDATTLYVLMEGNAYAIFLDQCVGWDNIPQPPVDPEPVCPQGQVGTPPNCTTPQPPVCPEGQTGTPPNCTPVVVTPPTDTTPVVTPPPVDTTPVVVPPPVVTIDPPIVVDPPKPTLKATPKPKAPVAKATRTGNRVAVSFKVGDKRFAGRTAIVKIVSGKKVVKTVTIRLPAKSKTTKVKLSSKTMVNGKVKVVRKNVRVTKPAGVSERIIILPAKKLGKAKTLRVSVEMKATPTAKSSKPATRTVRIVAPRSK